MNSILAYMLHKCGIKYIDIFNGKDEILRPDRIAGLEGAVSLGTNVCGRGTDIIQRSSKHLYVIVSNFSSDTRVMHQAYRRTAHQGNKGTFRVICVSDQYPAQPESYDDTEMESVINDFEIKNDEQRSFIDHFKQNRSWIFSGDIGSQHLCRQDIAKHERSKN